MRINELMHNFENTSTADRQLLFEELRTFEKRHPDSFILKHYLGICCWGNGEYSQSEDYFIQSLKIVPEEPLTMYLLQKLYAEWAAKDSNNKRSLIEKRGSVLKKFRDLYWFIDEKNFNSTIIP